MNSPPESTSAGTFAPGDTPATVAEDWNISTPEEQGMDSRRLAELITEIKEKDLSVHGLVVVRNGYIVSEAYFYPYRLEVPHNIYSCTKSVTSALIGIALQQGLLKSVDQPVLEFFPEPEFARLNSRKSKITLRHLLTMTAGLDWNESGNYASPANSLFQMKQSPNWVQYVLEKPLVNNPGEKFYYSSGASHLLSAILQRVSGKTADQFAAEFLFKPLGITAGSWPADPQGNPDGGSELHLRPRDLAKFGYLYLENGVWQGKQIVPAEWVKASTQPQAQASSTKSYGYHWWLDAWNLDTNQDGQPERIEGYYAQGHSGQYLYVIPALKLVAVFTSGFPSGQNDLPRGLFESYILAATRANRALPPNPEGQGRLAQAIQAAAQSNLQPRPIPAAPELAQQTTGKIYLLETNLLGLTAAQFDFSNPREARITFTFAEGPSTLVLGLDGVYRDGEFGFLGPAVSRGEWESNGHTFRAEIRPLGECQVFVLGFHIYGQRLAIDLSESVDGFKLTINGTLK